MSDEFTIKTNKIPVRCYVCGSTDIGHENVIPKSREEIYRHAMCQNEGCDNDWYEIFKMARVIRNQNQ